MKKEQLSQSAWLAAGFRALAAEGPKALRAEPLARALGTTKGSFYWHFRDLPAFHTAMLALWRSKAGTQVIDQLSGIAAPAARLRALIEIALKPAPSAYGGARVEPAIRAWALQDAQVAGALVDVDALRVAYIQGVLAELGQSDPDAGLAIYSAFVGLDAIAAHTQIDAPAAMARLLDGFGIAAQD